VSTTPARVYEQGGLYVGNIVSQKFVYGRDEIPCLILRVELKRKLHNSRKPELGSAPCPEGFAEVQLQFVEDEERMQRVIDDLQKLGFHEEEIEKLNPANKNHHSLINAETYVAPTYKESNGSEICYWNLRFPRAFDEKAIPAKAVSKLPAASLYRDLIRRKKAGDTGTNGTGEKPPF
jgi:hypothetical protein